MKKLILLSIWMVMGIVVLEAQAPEKFSYQAVVRDGSNALVTSTDVGMQISILQGSANGVAVYMETQTPTTNANGLVSLEIGDGTVESGTFSTIDWANGPYFIKTETDPTGGTTYSIVGTSQLLSVPYALHAGNVKKYKIGVRAFGGIVFWVEECGQHGLVSDTVDLSTAIVWGGFGVTNAVRNGRYSGQYNTERIVIELGTASYAAQICANHNGSGYGDWYLPSIAELQLMYTNIGQGATGDLNNIGGFAGADYWSSTELFASVAWFFNFNFGFASFFNKSSTLRVRAVRAF